MKQRLRLHVTQHPVNPALLLWRVQDKYTGRFTLPTFSSGGAIRKASNYAQHLAGNE